MRTQWTLNRRTTITSIISSVRSTNWSGIPLKLSSDRKVSPKSVWRPKAARWEPIVRNSTGKKAGLNNSCPDATEWCAGSTGCCYAISTEKFYPSVLKLVTENMNELENESIHAISTIYRQAFKTYNVEIQKAESRFNISIPNVFRINWDGDIMSENEAYGLALAVRTFPNTQFWLYTRSFSYVRILHRIPNLTVYLSVDPYNVGRARGVKFQNPDVKLAFCADTWDDTEKLASQFPNERMGPKCPELTGKIPLVNDNGVGACVECGMCIYGRNNVRFARKRN